MPKIRIDTTYYDDANGLYITQRHYLAVALTYECTVERVTYQEVKR